MPLISPLMYPKSNYFIAEFELWSIPHKSLASNLFSQTHVYQTKVNCFFPYLKWLLTESETYLSSA